MKVLYYISVLTLFTAGLLRKEARESVAAPQVITVFAGNDQTICVNQSLTISSLGATIAGDVSNGDWITFGDGRFQPGNLLTVRYAVAQQTGVQYVPGPNDKALGFFRLMLISDAPVGGTPQQKVTDEVTVSFQSAPPIFCSSGFNLSLSETCTQKVDATMLTSNPVPPYTNYVITLYNADNSVIPGNVLTKAHIGKEITFKLGHLCTSNTCWGKFTVSDYYPPVFACRNDTLKCTRSISPDSVGLPLPSGAYADTIINKKYIIKSWDACSDVTLEFKDEVVKGDCSDDVDKRITRKWKATDASGNSSTCHQLIVVKKIKLSEVTFPPHYDGHDKPAFECLDTFPMLASGFPSPDTTGIPGTGACGNLQYTMTDVKFSLCGSSYKVARNWFVIDWCTSESLSKNQIIHVNDSRGPQVSCIDSLALETGPYSCGTDLELVPDPESVSDCSEIQVDVQLLTNAGQPLDQFLTEQGGQSYFFGLPVGVYRLVYTATDACGNTGECVTVVTVSDKTTPYVVCDEITKVALDNTGKGRLMAQSLDDGSTDNCGIATYKVRKMTDNCGFGTAWGDYVDFCCAEIQNPVMVALEVTDIYGNKNTCMVEVRVEDKLGPALTCPPNITLACTDIYDLNNLDVFGKVVTRPADVRNIYVNNLYHNGLAGKDGLATDNCGVTVTQSYTHNITCHTGQIRRKFVAMDGTGKKDSCTQIITILNPDPFDAGDITWPPNYTGTGCKSSQTGPDITGKPLLKNVQCGSIASSYEDQPFYIADGACLKIIRTWTVVDWCQFSGTGTAGKFGPYVQVIKLHNTDKPYFAQACRDTVVCSYDPACATGLLTLTKTAGDDCTDRADLVWRYEIDVNNNGTTDSIGHSNLIQAELPLGIHRIVWTVSDQCGNTTSCAEIVTIRDCKKPTPYCVSSLTITLMQATGTNTIWARDFDQGSSDNCTDAEDLIFTFGEDRPVQDKLGIEHYFEGQGVSSTQARYEAGLAQRWIPGTRSSGIWLDCDDIPNGREARKNVMMTVTDEYGNRDFCSVELVIQDNADHCPDVVTSATVSGRILTENNKVIKDVAVFYNGVETQGNVTINNATGVYATPPLEITRDYTVRPSLGGDPLLGVSTIDLVKIQRHILGLDLFDSPYKHIAADVNGSASVTASDLVELRKLILGVTDRFPKSLPPWVFVKKNGGIPDPAVPFQYYDKIETEPLMADVTDADFTAVKLGDVNLSAVNLDENHTDKRSNETIMLHMSHRYEGGIDYLDFSFDESISPDGLQLFLDMGHMAGQYYDSYREGFSMPVTSDHHVSEGGFAFVMFGAAPGQITPGRKVLTIRMEAWAGQYPQLDKTRVSEVYVNGSGRKILLIPEKAATGFSLMHNPVYDRLYLRSHGDENIGDLDYQIFNADGKQINAGYLSGINENELAIDLPQGLRPGLYVVKLTAKQATTTLKFILIR